MSTASSIAEKEKAINERKENIDKAQKDVDENLTEMKKQTDKIEELQKILSALKIKAAEEIKKLDSLKNDQFADENVLRNLRDQKKREDEDSLKDAETTLRAYLAAIPK